MKRDIWATITFLVTGLLFYLAQTAVPSETMCSDTDSLVAETVRVGKPGPEAPGALVSDPTSSRGG